MLTLQCTKKLLERIKPAIELPHSETTVLGNWHANILFWRPQLVILVNDRTLLPVLTPLAPATSLAQRFPIALKRILEAMGLPTEFIRAEIMGMSHINFAKTSNRSVLGVMNEFTYLAEGYRERFRMIDPLELALKLSETPCGPLYKGPISPDKAVRELVAGGAIQ